MSTLRVANKKHVWHLIERGMLSQIHFDFESYGLNTKFSQAKSYGETLGDIAGNHAGSQQLEIRRPDRALPTLEALSVIKTSPLSLDGAGRLPHPVAMAKIAQSFEDGPMSAAKFGVKGPTQWIRTVNRRGPDPRHKGVREEGIIHYPLFDPDGKTEIGDDGAIISDPPGMLKLNKKGEVVIGPDEKTVTIPKKVRLKNSDGKHEWTLVYKPMKPEDGAITFDVRIHPQRGRISYRCDDPGLDNHYYKDAKSRIEAKRNDELKGDKWKFSDMRLLVSGYRIKWFDIALLRANLIRAGFHPQNTFFTYSKARISSKERPKNFVNDAYSAVIETALKGPQDEEGLKLGKRIDPRSGEEVISAKLELVAQENSRYENKARGIRSGVFMPDGSLYDPNKAHENPSYDTDASFGIYNYCRELDPDLLKSLELQADEDELVRQLESNDLRENNLPVFASVRGNYPNKPALDPVAYISRDDQMGKLGKIITMRLDIDDLRTYRYNGKTLLQMAQEDLAQKDDTKLNFVRMLKDQDYHSDALVRVTNKRRFNMSRIEDVLHTEDARNWDIEQIDSNFRFLFGEEGSVIRGVLCRAVEVMNRELRQKPLPANPMLEEERPFNNFGDLDILEEDAGKEFYEEKKQVLPGRGMVKGLAQTLFEIATTEFNYHNRIEELVHALAIQPQRVDLYGYDDSFDKRDALARYWETFGKVYKELKKKNSPYIFLFDDYVEGTSKLLFPGKTRGRVESGTKPNGDTRYRNRVLNLQEMSDEQVDEAIEEVLSFRWHVKKRILHDIELENQDLRSGFSDGLFDQTSYRKGRVLLGNVTRDFRVIDERGREIEIDYIFRKYDHQPKAVLDKLESGEWRIQFFRQTSEPTATAILMQYADMGRLDELTPGWSFRYNALRALYLYGRPNEEADNMSWDAIPSLRRSIKAFRVNGRLDEKGALSRLFSGFESGTAESFLRSEEGQRILGEFEDMLDETEDAYPFSDEYKLAMGYDPQYDLPYDWVEDEIDAQTHVVIEVPDSHLRAPLEDIRHTPYALVIKAPSAKNRNRIVHKQIPVILRGAQTGRLYHGGAVNLIKAPKETASYSDFYEKAKRAYEDEAGMKFPKAEKRYLLKVGALKPVGNTRILDSTIQTFKVPQAHFDGLVSPRMAYFNDDEPLTGLVLPADYCPQKVIEGEPIRFREMSGALGDKILGEETKETGHLYETVLQKANRLTVGALLDEVNTGTFTDDHARRYGYAGAYDMWEKINAAFVNRESPEPMDEQILLLEFDPVDKTTWAYSPPYSALQAAFIKNGQLVPPLQSQNDNRRDEQRTKEKQDEQANGRQGPRPE